MRTLVLIACVQLLSPAAILADDGAGSDDAPVLRSAIYPAEKDGNRLCVARGTVQHFFFVPGNPSERTIDPFRFVLTVPEGVRVIQATGDAVEAYYRPELIGRKRERRDGRWYVRWEWEADRALSGRSLEKARFFNAWCGAMIAGEAVADGQHPFFWRIEADELSEPEREGTLVIMPRPKGRQPREIAIAMSGWTISPSPPFWRRLMRTYRDCGINTVDSGIVTKGDEWLRPAMDAGMERWRLLWWFWWNENHLQEHPEHAAVTFGGERDQRRVCPEIMASPDTDAIAGLMDGILPGARSGAIQGTWWDLEGPNVWDVCFCERCLRAFREFADIPAEVELTPQRIKAEYHDQWVKYCCGQSARIAERMKSYAREQGVDWDLAVYCAIQHDHTREHYRVDWEMLAPHLDLATVSYYSVNISDLEKRYTSGVTWMVDLIQSVKDIPVWATISTGYGRDSHYIADGRVTRMHLIKPVAFGANGVIQWWWGPVDGRHYHAYAEASLLIAELEPFFTDGEMDQELLSGEPREGTTRVAWRLGDRVLVMLFNDRDERRIYARPTVPNGSRLERDDGRGRLKLEGQELSASVEPLDCRWVILRLGGE
ncbi:MAG: hypothetical protein U9R79_21055 [Armatimonadota bacterium]|nr:hypothetical protein [Armatimonadota bacterium]